MNTNLTRLCQLPAMLSSLLLTTAIIFPRKKKKTNYKMTGRLSVATCNRFIMIIRDAEKRNEQLVGFTPPSSSKSLADRISTRIQAHGNRLLPKARYRLKQTFVDYIVRGHFDKSRAKNEIVLKESFSSFAQLDARCHALTLKYKGKTLPELREMLGIDAKVKDISAKCVIRMFGTDCNRLNQISDFNKAGIIAKTITITPQGGRTEDMKLKHIDFEEWADRDADFEDSDVYDYFCEHSFLCPIFCEHDSKDPSKTVFEGFKRFAFDEDFIENEFDALGKIPET